MTELRRDHRRSLILIQTVALLLQHQHELKEIVIDGESMEYIEVTKREISMANTVADCVSTRLLREKTGEPCAIALRLISA